MNFVRIELVIRSVCLFPDDLRAFFRQLGNQLNILFLLDNRKSIDPASALGSRSAALPDGGVLNRISFNTYLAV